jgi:hypothetical protein
MGKKRACQRAAPGMGVVSCSLAGTEDHTHLVKIPKPEECDRRGENRGDKVSFADSLSEENTEECC